MLSNSTKNLHTFFANDKTLEEAKTKEERIEYITNKLDLHHLLGRVTRSVTQLVKKDSKNEGQAKSQLEVIAQKYDVFLESNCVYKQLLRNIIEDTRQVIILAQYGGSTFAKSYRLLAKCFLKTNEFASALYCLEMSAKYSHQLSGEMILIKAIALFSMNMFVELKSWLTGCDQKKLQVSDELKKEFTKLGFGHLNMDYLTSFVNDPNFANGSEAEPAGEFDENSMNNPIEMKTNYQIDNRCEIVNDVHKGRHFISKGFIPRGTQVLVERSYSVVLETKSQLEICLGCNQLCPNTFVPCRHCTKAVFCSEPCFASAWTLSHRFECGLLDTFQDSFYVSLHMYRAISRIGVTKAIQVKKELEQQMGSAEIVDEANEKGKTPKDILFDRIITQYLENEDMRKTVEYQQTDEQKMELYRMMSTLLDHDEKFESYYDVCYMGVAIDVALLLLINRFLINKQQSDKIDEQARAWARLEEDNFNKLLTQELYAAFSKEEYQQLVAIVLVNIRKLSTNVFSWNLYTESSSVRKNIGSCQCLVGSLINHSCDPNIEWDFRNGCIVYTSTRDIMAGEEMNNSYGPYKGGDFKERQLLLANNYYFNCCCSACREDMVTYPKMLKCGECDGPVVYLDESYINSSCMDCHTIMARSKDIIGQVLQKRTEFQSSCKLFESISYLPDTTNVSIENLIELLEFQLNNVPKGNTYLQLDIDRLCRLLYQVGEKDKAHRYIPYKLITYKPFHIPGKVDSEGQDEDYGSDYNAQVEHVKSLIFWFRLFSDYIAKQQESALVGNVAIESDQLALAQRHFVEAHSYIQRLILTLSYKCKAKVNSLKVNVEALEPLSEPNSSNSLDAMLSSMSKNCQQHFESTLASIGSREEFESF